jgi:Domain of unknown function (DUF4126)
MIQFRIVNLTLGELVPILVAITFAAGLNVYATVVTLGLLARAEVFTLPPSLHLLQSWPVIVACLALFALEFVGDKIPIFDLVWNALHTFVRVPVAALLAYGATMELSPEKQLACTILGGLIALAAHGGKIAARAAVTPSPEPFSNISLSLGEDVLAVFLVWLATQHPFWSAAIFLVFLVVILIFARFVWRSLRALLGGAERTVMGAKARSVS